MKLYNVPRLSRIKLLEDANTPPSAPLVKQGDEINFIRLDGMYSYCTNDQNQVVHIGATTEVEVL